MKKIKILCIILAIAILLLSIATLLVNIFLPKQIEALIKKTIKASLSKNIDIQKISFSLNGTLTLTNVNIYDDKADTPTLRAQSLQILPFYPSLINRKLLVISSIKIINPCLTLTRDKQGNFNIPRVKRQEKKSAKKLIIKTIIVKGLNLKINDKLNNFKEDFERIDISVKFSLPVKLNFRVNIFDKTTKMIEAYGTFSFSDKALRATVKARDIDISRYKNYLSALGSLNSAKLKEMRLDIKGKDEYEIKAKARITGINLINEKFSFSGNLDIEPVLSFTYGEKEITYRVNAYFSNGKLGNIPYLEKIEKIEAKLNLTKDKLNITSLNASLNNNSLKLRGSLSDFNNPYLDMQISYTGSIKTLKDIAGRITKIPSFVQPQGYASINADLRGNLKQNNYTYKALFSIENARINGIKDITAINCRGNLDNKRLDITNLTFVYKDIPVKGNLQLKRNLYPEITIALESELLNAKTTLILNKNILTISSLELLSNQSRVEAKGYVELDGLGMKFQGLGQVLVSDILKIIEKLNIADTSAIKKLKPQGIVDLGFVSEGKPNTESWLLKMSGMSDNFKISQTHLKGMRFTLNGEGQTLNINPSAGLWDGTANAQIIIDRLKDKAFASVTAQNINLSKMNDALSLKRENLSGALFLNARFEHLLSKDIKQASGQGKLIIKQGNIWQLNPLKGLGEFLAISDFNNITFKEGYVEFMLRKKKLFIESFELFSDKMNLKGKGNISFEGELDFVLFPVFSDSLREDSEKINKIIADMLRKSTLSVEIKGNIKNPRYKIESLLLSPLKTLRNIFEDILK